MPKRIDNICHFRRTERNVVEAIDDDDGVKTRVLERVYRETVAILFGQGRVE